MYAVDNGGWREQSGGCCAEINLSIISVAMEIKAVLADDLAEREHVYGEEDWTKYGTLGDTVVNWGWVRGGTMHGDKLQAVGEVGVKPGERRSGDVEVCREAVEEDGVRDCVEGCREVQQDEDADLARISCHKEVVGNFDQGGLSAVVCSVARLEGFEESMVGHVVLELCGDYPLQGLTEEREIGRL